MKSIETMLAEIPDMADEAWRTKGTKVVSSDGHRGRSVPGSRCLADLDRMLALSGANDYDGLGVLAGWVRMIAEERDEAGEPAVEWPADTVRAASEWIAGQLRWCMGRGFEAELHEEIRRLHGTLSRITHRNGAKPWPCLTEGCQGSMAMVDGMLECQHGHRHDGLRKWRHHPSMRDKDVAEALNLPVGTIRSWKSRGKIGGDEAKDSRTESWVWPWDVLRMRYPDLVELIEHAEAA